MLEHYISQGGHRLRCGYTTGTCAAAASRAAAMAVLSGHFPESVEILTPAGIAVTVTPENCVLGEGFAQCAVRKDGGDDCDVTSGALIVSRVERIPEGIRIDGGEGVGRVTRPGLDQPPGNAAINRVPRNMIENELKKALEETGSKTGLRAVISVPDGKRLAEKTFNPRLGIEGGISILGSTGIVRPMSRQALVDTIGAELKVRRAENRMDVLMTPGNYGADYARNALGLEIGKAVQCSNYIGDALDLAAALGFSSVLLVGHVGKLCKAAAGVMDTHSRTADGRREVFVTHAALLGGSPALLRKLYEAPTTDAALALLEGEGLRQRVLQAITVAAGENLQRRGGGMNVQAILYSQAAGCMAKTSEADVLLTLHKKNEMITELGGSL